jgi:AraC-like DNA-binding protein
MEVDFGWPFPAALSLYDDAKVLSAHPYYARAHTLIDQGRLLEEADYVEGAPFEWSRVTGEVLAHAFGAENNESTDLDELVERLERNFAELLPKPTYSGLTARATALLERELEQSISGDALAAKLGVSRPHLLATFKRDTGTTLHDYATTLRVTRAKELLHNTNLSVGEIATRLGYKSIFHFSRVFKTETQVSPREYRARPTL